MQNLTEQQIDFLKSYFHIFYKAFRNITGKTIQTLDELIEIIISKQITFDDVFDEYVARCFDDNELTDNEEDYYLANLDAYSHENYLTLHSNKNVGSGSWVKIRTPSGYEIHYAKVSTRKIRYNEIIERIQTKFLNKSKKLNSGSKSKEYADVLSGLETPKYLDAKIRYYIGLQPLQIRIKRNKNKTEYYLPYQYEIVNNIDEYCDLYLNELPHLKVKSITTDVNEDKIFYLQSRGISRRNAEILASLSHSYFTFNLIAASETYNNLFKINLVVSN